MVDEDGIPLLLVIPMQGNSNRQGSHPWPCVGKAMIDAMPRLAFSLGEGGTVAS